jgi:putative transposase
MKQTMRLKLVPTPDQHAALLETLHAFNAACTYAAEQAFAARTANQFERQKLVYGALRATYHLPAQLAIRAISKTVEAYQRDKDTQPPFRPEGAIVYDPRGMSFKGPKTVSLLTLSGRVLGPFWVREYQAPRREAIQGQADLLYRHGTFFLAVTLEMPEPQPDTPDGGTLGVDLGIVNLATASPLQRSGGGTHPCPSEHLAGGSAVHGHPQRQAPSAPPAPPAPSRAAVSHPSRHLQAPRRQRQGQPQRPRAGRFKAPSVAHREHG